MPFTLPKSDTYKGSPGPVSAWLYTSDPAEQMLCTVILVLNLFLRPVSTHHHAASEVIITSTSSWVDVTKLAVCTSLGQGRHPFQNDPSCLVVCAPSASRLECCPLGLCYVWAAAVGDEASCKQCPPSTELSASLQARSNISLPVQSLHSGSTTIL